MGKWETMPAEKPKVKKKKEKNSPFTGCRRQTSAQFVSRTHLQLRPGDVSKRHCLVKIKDGPKSAGRGTPGAGEMAGDRCAEGIQWQQGAEELVHRKAAAAAGAAGDPHARDDWWGSEEPAERPAAAVARAIGGTSTSGVWCRDARPEVDPGGDKETPAGVKEQVPTQGTH